MTPEEIVALIGNIGNRPDIQDVQEKQVEEIYKLIKEFEDMAKEWKKGYCDLDIKHRIKIGNLEQIIYSLQEEIEDLKNGRE
jgi:hypothetical protein